MNILQAVNSGFPFKREGWDTYYVSTMSYKAFDLVDIKADDWVILKDNSPITQLEMPVSWEVVTGELSEL